MNEEMFFNKMNAFSEYVAHPLIAIKLSDFAKLSDIAQEIRLMVLMLSFQDTYKDSY